MRASTSQAGTSLFLAACFVVGGARSTCGRDAGDAVCLLDGRRAAAAHAGSGAGSSHRRTARAAHPHRVLASQSGAVPKLDRPPLHARLRGLACTVGLGRCFGRRRNDATGLDRRVADWSCACRHPGASSPDDPCARQPGFDDRFGFGRMRRYCADRRAMAPPPIVEMPAGFAPLLGIDGIFVKSSGPSTGPTPPLPPPVASAPPAPPPKVARSEPPQPPARAEPIPLPPRGLNRRRTGRKTRLRQAHHRPRSRCSPRPKQHRLPQLQKRLRRLHQQRPRLPQRQVVP